jgi:TolB protein
MGALCVSPPGAYQVVRFGGVAWSPNGDRLAYALFDDSSKSSSICIVNSDGSNPVKLTTTQYDPFPFTTDNGDTSPSWSPDGSKIAFSRRIDRKNYIYIMNADGTDQVRLTQGTQPAWQPVPVPLP